jgi:hypothetical protein
MSRIPVAARTSRLRFSNSFPAATEWLLIATVIAMVAATVLMGV